MKVEELAVFDELKANVALMAAPALALQVSNFHEASIAIEVGKQIKGYLKAIEKTRKELTAPLKEKAKAIENYANLLEAPLLQAETHIKRVAGAFELQQHQIRQEALRKERMEQEAREAAARAVADAERARVKAEADALIAEAQEQAQRESEAAAAFGDVAPNEDVLKNATLEAETRILETQVALANEAAVRQAENQQANWHINDKRIKNSSQGWGFEIEHPGLVPRDLCVPHDTLIKKRLKETDGAAIAGIRSWPEMNVRLGSKTSVSRNAIESDG